MNSIENFEDNEIDNTDPNLTFEIFNGHVIKIRELIEKEYLDESVILVVTIFEVLLENVFKMSAKYWFYDNSSQYSADSQYSRFSSKAKEEYRKKIRLGLLKTAKHCETEYLHNFYKYQGIVTNPELDSLYITLFTKNERSKINFQNLNNAKNAYQIFFGIDISQGLDTNQTKSQTMWELLDKLFKERHNIIHKGHKTTLTKAQIFESLNSINFLKDDLSMKFTQIFSNEVTKNVFERIGTQK
jgi:hypothetical protein